MNKLFGLFGFCFFLLWIWCRDNLFLQPRPWEVIKFVVLGSCFFGICFWGVRSQEAKAKAKEENQLPVTSTSDQAAWIVSRVDSAPYGVSPEFVTSRVPSSCVGARRISPWKNSPTTSLIVEDGMCKLSKVEFKEEHELQILEEFNTFKNIYKNYEEELNKLVKNYEEELKKYEEELNKLVKNYEEELKNYEEEVNKVVRAISSVTQNYEIWANIYLGERLWPN